MDIFKKVINKIYKIMKKTLKVLSIIFLMFLIIGSIAAVYLGYKYYPDYQELTQEAKVILSEADEETFIRLEPTKIIRKDGTLVREFTPAKYVYIKNADMPSNVKKAFISIEDKNFYTHDGVDYKAILRAGVALVKNKGEITQGGSTITQQLIKTIFLTNEQTYVRKIKEVFLAWEIEKTLDKDLILEYYVNNIYFANGVYGIETASNYYFSKPSSELTLAETAFLVAIPNNPTIFNPIDNKDNTIKRQTLILKQMLEDEIITQDVYDKEVNQEIELNILEKSAYIPENFEISYVMHSAIESIIEYEGLPIKNKFNNNEERKEYKKIYDEKFAEVNKRLRQGGYTITSTIDPAKQELLQASVNSGLQKFTEVSEDNLYKTQGAAITIDNITHELVAIVGGRTEEGQVNTFNRAALSYRQPGSVIKPITAYGVEADIELLGFSIYEDIEDKKGPKNSNGKFQGKITAREALVQSINTIPFEIIKNRGPSLVHEYLFRMGFSKIVDEDKNAGIAIGGFTYGTTPLEIAGAYSTLANNGIYVKPTGIDTILFKDEIIYKNNKEEVPVYKEGSAYLMTDILKGVFTGEGTGKKIAISHPAAGKTGTTDDNKDGWFAGYTPYYTTVVWVGNDTPKKVNNLWGSTYPGTIWKNYMSTIHQDLDKIDFEKPPGTKIVYVKPGTEKVYGYEIKGYDKEIIPIHLLNSVDIISKNETEETEEPITKPEDTKEENIEPVKDEATIFFEKYGVTLESEVNQLNYLIKTTTKIFNAEINNEEDLNYTLEELDKMSNQINTLHSEDNKIYIKKLINSGKTFAKEKYKNIPKEEPPKEEPPKEETPQEEVPEENETP